MSNNKVPIPEPEKLRETLLSMDIPNIGILEATRQINQKLGIKVSERQIRRYVEQLNIPHPTRSEAIKKFALPKRHKKLIANQIIEEIEKRIK